MASKLSIYNGALLILGERKLASLAENRAPRRRLDTVWNGDTGVEYCLQQGLWNFAMNTVGLTYSPSVSPAFGYIYAFDKPTDWVRTARVSDDPQFINCRLDFEDQAAYWFGNNDTLYVKYVSKDVLYGLDLSLWTPAFTSYVEHHFAAKIAKVTTGSDTERERCEVLAEKRLRAAKNIDAMDESVKFLPPGSWALARRGPRSRSDGGSNTRLLG